MRRQFSRTLSSPDARAEHLDTTSETRRRLLAAIGDEFEIRHLLGEGGFAEVFLAWDRTLKREVAIKALRAEHGASPELLARFRAEAEAIAQLRHPHIVPIYSVAEREGIAWFVMPKVSGVSLAELLARGERWSFSEGSRVIREAATALAAAHRAGIVHRDVKPENIMLDGPDRRVLLMDFGIAKSLGATSAGSARTATGMIIGTPQYMSPEQMLGDSAVGPASDQYSLGLVAYRLFAGELAFKADSLPALMMKSTIEDPRPLRDLRPDIPHGLANAVVRSLAKEPSARFASMDEFADALSRVAEEVAGEFRRGRRLAPLAERWDEALRQLRERRRAMLTMLIVGVLLAVVGFPFARSSAMYDVLRLRDDATFRARALAQELGVRRSARATFQWESRIYPAIQRSVLADSADRLASTVYNVWHWDMAFGGWELGEPGSLVAGYADSPFDGGLMILMRQTTPDMRTASISAEAARVIADSVLRARREDPTTLEYRGVASTIFPAYSQHAFSWRVPGRTVAVAGDTLALGITVRVIGTTATVFGRFGRLVRATAAPPTWRAVFLIIFPILIVAVGAFATVVAIRRSGVDVLQWRTALRITAPVAAVWLALYSIGMHIAEPSLDDLSRGLTQELPAELCAWLLAAVTLATAESMLYDSRPWLTAGLDDLARGEFHFPELVPAAASGYALGLFAFGLMSAGLAIAHRLFGVPYSAEPLLSIAFMHPFPATVPMLALGVAIPLSSVSLFAVALASQRRIAIALLCAGAISLTAALLYGWLPNELVIAVSVIVGLVPIVTSRVGFLASAIAVTTALGVPVAVEMVAVGGPFRTAGLLALLILFAPAGLAWQTLRHRGTFRGATSTPPLASAL